jgi:hypothetical protein|tara:strand:+ start:1443 stop:1676 length:234 start_codon:yes stop_codon:yes gene_type:complete
MSMLPSPASTKFCENKKTIIDPRDTKPFLQKIAHALAVFRNPDEGKPNLMTISIEFEKLDDDDIIHTDFMAIYEEKE